MMMHLKTAVASMALVIGLSTVAQAASTLDTVKSRGKVLCGVTTGLADSVRRTTRVFGLVLTSTFAGSWPPLYSATQAGQYKAAQRRAAVHRPAIRRSGLVARNSTWTMSRDTQLGLDFVTVNYYDGQGFMVKKDLHEERAGAEGRHGLRARKAPPPRKIFGDYDKANNLGIKPVKFKETTSPAAPTTRAVATPTTDASGLASERTVPEEPGRKHHPARDHLQGALRSRGTSRRQPWGDIVRWTHYATLIAEEKALPRLMSIK